MRHLSLQVRIPDDVEHINEDSIDALRFEVMSQGLDLDHAATLMMIAAQGLVQSALAREIREDDPLESEDLVQTTSVLGSRIALMDMLMHIPMRSLGDDTLSVM